MNASEVLVYLLVAVSAWIVFSLQSISANRSTFNILVARGLLDTAIGAGTNYSRQAYGSFEIFNILVVMIGNLKNSDWSIGCYHAMTVARGHDAS